LRIVVAHDHVVGAISRVAAPGEWRTNVALGAQRRRMIPPPEACALALAATRATGAELVGVDLLPDGCGRWTVAELNGAVEFNGEYALTLGGDPFAEAAVRLAGAAICARVGVRVHATV
jgi:glutathione synthase/RimK-type ligase-like ATP-grasp enzyme